MNADTKQPRQHAASLSYVPDRAWVPPCVPAETSSDLPEGSAGTQGTHARTSSSSHPSERGQEGEEGKKAAPAAALASLSPTDWLLTLLDLAGAEPKGAPLRQCPAHLDSTPSLSVKAGADGRALVHCFAGCRTEDVLLALGISWRHLYDEPWLTPDQHLAVARPRLSFPPVVLRSGSPASTGMRLVGVHEYGKRWRLERYRHPATGAKDLRWFTLRNGAAIPGLLGVALSELPLYRENEVHMAVGAGELVVVCESESSVDALCSAGIYATTWAGGAATPQADRLAYVLRGARVLLVPDHDEAGMACGDLVRTALQAAAVGLSTVLPAPGCDARDLLAESGPGAFEVIR